MQRYVLQSTLDQLLDEFGAISSPHQTLKSNFNAAPGHLMSIVYKSNDQLMMDFAVWDATQPTISIDDASQKTHMHFTEDPCIVPISGFYIWKETVNDPLPFFVRIHSQPILAIAAFLTKKGEFRNSFAVLTQSANVLIQPVEQQMPAILAPNQHNGWLIDETNNLIQSGFTHNTMIPDMTVFRVPDLVNDLSNNGPELLQPIPKLRDED